MDKWYVKLTGDASTLRELSTILNTDDCRISYNNQEECYLLESSKFDDIKNHSEVYRLGLKLLDGLSGPLRFEFGYSAPKADGHVINIKKDGTRTVSAFACPASIGLTIGAPSATVSIDGVVITYESPISKKLRLQREDEYVRKALAIYKKEALEWSDLYILYEIIQEDIGGNPYSKKWIDQKEEYRLNQTAQHYRHGPKKERNGNFKFPLPAEPMEIAIARKLIKIIVNKWIDSKLA